MVLLTHIIIALASVAYATVLFIRPSKNSFRISYALVVSTLASGTFLVVSMHASLVQACTTGILYLGAVSTLIVLARARFAKQKIV